MFGPISNSISDMCSLRNFNKLWTTICVIAAVSTMTWQLMNYLSGQDSTIVEFKDFNKDRIDMYPNIGICFSKFFGEKKLEMFAEQINGKITQEIKKLSRISYSMFLYGSQRYGHKKMFDVDYDAVSMDFEKFIYKYTVTTDDWEEIVLYDEQNETTNSLKNHPWFKVHSMFGQKCFSLNFPYKQGQKLTQAHLTVKPSIFPNNTRPSNVGSSISSMHWDDMFAVALHYPNQLLRKISTQQRNWPDRSNKRGKSYTMEFNIRNAEVIVKRNKYGEPCAEDIPNFDLEIYEWIMNSVGCKPPYWKNFPLTLADCNTIEQLRHVRQLLLLVYSGKFVEANYTGRLPCRSLERIQFDVSDIETPDSDMARRHKVARSLIKLKFNFREFTYKEVKSVRSMDIQGLIGNGIDTLFISIIIERPGIFILKSNKLNSMYFQGTLVDT